MRIQETAIAGVLAIELDPIGDERGFFARMWDRASLEDRGINAEINQISIAFNALQGTVRGLHFQVAPHEEAKTIRCVSGAIFDVAIDLRPSSQTYTNWVGVELTAENRRSLIVPEGCAHGYMTLRDDTEVIYQISAPHAPEASRGHRWDDPAFAIEWPLAVRCVSSRDLEWPAFEREMR